MLLKTGEAQLETQYTVKAITGLKRTLKCRNLRKMLIAAANDEDYETLGEALTAFTGGKLKDPYGAIDAYVSENGVSAYEMFLQLIHEIGESGFFKEKRTVEELRKLAESPEIDTGEVMEAVMREFQGNGAKELARAIATGATTLKISEGPLTSVE